MRHLVRTLLHDAGIDDTAPHDDAEMIGVRSVGVTDTLFVDTLPATLADIAMLRHRFAHWLERPAPRPTAAATS